MPDPHIFPPVIRVLAVGLSMLVPMAAPADPYRLHPQDRLLIRVLTWEFSQSAQMSLDKVSGEYTITPEGQLQLPLAGPVHAAGQSLAELSVAASDMLRRAAGMQDPLHVSVELVSSAPVYVMGAVQTRGAVVFRPGLTARQALALAGDLYRVTAANDMMRSVAVTGDVLASEDKLRRLRHEEGLVKAELDALSAQTSLDPAPADPPAAGAADDGDVQARLLKADRESRRTRAASLQDLQDLLTSKIDRLDQQMTLRDEQIGTVSRDLQDIQSLKDKGLAANARVTALSTSLNDLEARRLELETTLLLTEQQLNQAERDSGTIEFDALTRLLLRLGELQSEIAREEISLSTARQLQVQMLIGQGTGPSDDPVARPVFTIIRPGAGHLRVSPDALLAPGDTLEVTLPAMDQIAAGP